MCGAMDRARVSWPWGASSPWGVVLGLALAVPVGSTGCASRRGVTWEEVESAHDDGVRAHGDGAQTRRLVHPKGSPVAGPMTPTPVAAPAPTRTAVATTAVRAAAGPRIDAALQAFVNTRVLSRSQGPTSAVWTEAWEEMLRELGAAAALPPRASDLGAYVRARVTLEVEFAHDVARRVLLPSDLARRVQTVLVAVDESVEELRAANVPGTLRPPPRLGDGELILRTPLSPFIVSSPFGVRSDPFTGTSRFHAGVDLDAPHGTTVHAAASGLVVYAGLQGGYGKQVIVDHGDGVRTHYSHLSTILVDPGQTVEEGDAVAQVGSTGRSTGPHLHFAVTNLEGEFIDPAAVLDVPWSAIADQVKVGPTKSKQGYMLKNQGDTVEITALPR